MPDCNLVCSPTNADYIVNMKSDVYFTDSGWVLPFQIHTCSAKCAQELLQELLDQNAKENMDPTTSYHQEVKSSHRKRCHVM